MKKPNPKTLQLWLRKQIERANELIEESRLTKNYGKQTHYLGMKQAYLEILERLTFNKESTI